MLAEFESLTSVGLRLPGVEVGKRRDGTEVLKVRGSFLAGMAVHPSAEPGSMVVRIGAEERSAFLEDAPDVYYLTDYYRRHPVVLVRLARVSADTLRELLEMSRRITVAKSRP